MSDSPTPVFTNSEKFSLEVERRQAGDPKTSYLDHAAQVLIELGVDPADGAPLISKTLKEKIKKQSMDLRLIKERNTTLKLV